MTDDSSRNPDQAHLKWLHRKLESSLRDVQADRDVIKNQGEYSSATLSPRTMAMFQDVDDLYSRMIELLGGHLAEFDKDDTTPREQPAWKVSRELRYEALYQKQRADNLENFLEWCDQRRQVTVSSMPAVRPRGWRPTGEPS